MVSNRVSINDLRVDTSYKLPNEEETVDEALKRLEFQRKERLQLVPTDDEDVKACLELLGEPIVNANEENAERRERLTELLFKNEEHMRKFLDSVYGKGNQRENTKEANEDEDEDEFYTPASIQLIEARKFLIKDSLQRARRRLELQKESLNGQNIQREILYRRNLNHSLSQFELTGSQIASTRPISQVVFSPTGEHIASGSWAGDIKIVERSTLDIVKEFRTAHNGKIGGLDWHESGKLVVSGAADNCVKVWNTSSNGTNPAAVLTGHVGRVARVKFHPCGRFIASASFDTTWRLWDLESQDELQLQEGHAKEVFCLAFQSDGSLICSAGLDSLGIVWDIRIGKSIMLLEGHAKPIYGLDWSPNGYHIATGGADGAIKLWDIRRKGTVGTIMANKGIVSEVKFDKARGSFLVSSSYDKTVSLFSADNWKPIASLEGHTDKVLSVDISKDGDNIISSGWDRSVKLWTLPN
ncbi:LAFE_0H17282g1_1 [Lachancea fermentati]|uniref:LAFE_0H17282g1_1 n=1 Tax=Lachancea fermentati TaxID=4955 RepID=A0A1G4MLD9_LACFM|nr:LAFE_0H17282g1_1 [Lachancea fermentati]